MIELAMAALFILVGLATIGAIYLATKWAKNNAPKHRDSREAGNG